MKKKKRSSMYAISCLLFAFVLLGICKDTYAADYKVWVGDVQVSDGNKNDVLGDGGSVHFIPAQAGEPARLILNNALIQTAHQTGIAGMVYSSGIASEEDLIIELLGENKILLPIETGDASHPQFLESRGIDIEKGVENFIIEGEGKLEIHAANAKNRTAGIMGQGAVMLRGNAELKISLNEAKNMNKDVFAGIELVPTSGGDAEFKICDNAKLKIQGPGNAAEPFEEVVFIMADRTEILDQARVYLQGALAKEKVIGVDTAELELLGAAGLMMKDIGETKKFVGLDISDLRMNDRADLDIRALGEYTDHAEGCDANNVKISGRESRIYIELAAHQDTRAVGITAFNELVFAESPHIEIWIKKGKNPSAALSKVPDLSTYLNPEVLVGMNQANSIPLAPAAYSLISNKRYVRIMNIPVLYTVSFDPGGGAVDPPSMKTKGNGKLLSLPTPVWDGHIFLGWFTAADGGSMVDLSTVYAADTTIFAHWKEDIRYTVSFDPRGGAIDPPSMKTEADGRLASLPTPVRGGYKFLGWFTAADGGGIVDFSAVYNADTTLFAHWEAIGGAGGGSGGSGGSSGGGSSGSGSSEGGGSSGGGSSRRNSGGGSASSIQMGSWKQDQTGWCYQYHDGSWPKNEWKKIGGIWYFFKADGYMASGWQLLGGVWYYLGDANEGRMKTGWQLIGMRWYFFAESGAMKTGWLESGTKWYYLSEAADSMQGAMLADTTVGGYRLGSDGAWIP